MQRERLRESQIARLSALVMALLLLAGSMQGQSYPAAEAYFGFTVLNNEYGSDRHNSPGVVFDFGYNVRRSVRIVADFGAEFHDTNIFWVNGRKAHVNDYQMLFGPELVLRKSSKVTPFVHGLVGMGFRRYAVPSDSWSCDGFMCSQDSFNVAKESGFATGVGGGVDWHVRRGVSMRIAQFDWIRTNLNRANGAYAPVRNQLPSLGANQDNYRFSFGLTLHIGARRTRD
ncbi:MAG TPA: hypothetical protein VMU05_02265 [Dongiaceae bacterium]|nr:hypothetical protein [Dongiaceae bacterium]